jgi:hypothetical protein
MPDRAGNPNGDLPGDGIGRDSLKKVESQEER